MQAKACQIGVIFKNTLTPPGDCEREKRVKLVMDKIWKIYFKTKNRKNMKERLTKKVF